MKTFEPIMFLLVMALVCIIGCSAFDQWVKDNTQTPTTKPGEAPPTDEERSDEFVGNTIRNIGIAVGTPLLAAAGVLYGRIKPRKIIKGLVAAWQGGRQELKDQGEEAALAHLDKTVGDGQREHKGLENFVRRVKKKAKIRSVNGRRDGS